MGGIWLETNYRLTTEARLFFDFCQLRMYITKMMFDYKNTKTEVVEILESPVSIVDVGSNSISQSNVAAGSGRKGWVACVTVHFANLNQVFATSSQENLVRILKSFTTIALEIFRASQKLIDYKIRDNDLIFLFTVPMKVDLGEVFTSICYLNTFQNLFQHILKNEGLPSLSVGIGADCDRVFLFCPFNEEGIGFSASYYFPDILAKSSKLANEAGSPTMGPVLVSSLFYSNVCDLSAGSNSTNKDLFSKIFSNSLGSDVYSADPVITSFSKWIEEDQQRDANGGQ